jgi:enoyl-CoA hydratase/carnithine racemase
MLMNIPQFENLQVEVEGGIAVLTVNRPEKRNALNAASHRDLYNFAEMLDDNPELRVGIITATDKRVFISGNDISDFVPPDTFWPKNTLRDAIDRIWRCGTPVIMAINGHAVGGGFELALAGDIIIMTENATLSLPETNLGIIPGACGIQRLARCAGIAVAKEMALTGRRMSAQEALDRGIAFKTVAFDDLRSEAMAIAQTLAARAPLALDIAKKSANASLDMDYHSAQMMEEWGERALIGTQDSTEGSRAFLEKRPPEYKGR